MSPTRTTPKRSLAIGSAVAVAVALGLSGCGEYSPVAPEKEQPPATQRDDDSRDDVNPTDSDEPALPDSIPDAAPPASPPSTDTQQPGSGGGATPRNRQGGGSGGSGGNGGTGGGGGNGGSGGSGGQGGGGGSGGNGGGQPPTVVYAWDLPKSDTSPNNFDDGPAYGYLESGDCDTAAAYLAPNRLTNEPVFGVFNMKTPRYVVLLSAGVAMCRGSFDEARASYTYSMTQWGVQGLDHPSHPVAEDGVTEVRAPWRRGYREPECDLYRTLTFALTGVVADTLQCPGGERPLHRYVAYASEDPATNVVEEVIVWDNPLTFTVDESLVPPEHWTGAPGTPGTSDQIGPKVAGDPDDEFDFPEPPPGVAAPLEAAALEAAEQVATEAAVEPTAAEPAPAEPEADQPAPAEPVEVEPVGVEPVAVEQAPVEPAPADAAPASEPEPEASVPAVEPASAPAEPATPPVTAEPPAAPPAESELTAPAAP
ncbi:hypothetical protein [Microbacterium sp. NPDC056057]|uniref:hypothetical protein n=1 Tax=Microbacterium sp. NPDC056057 TaxID=3345699 RepID=UPI0035DB2AA8